MVLSSPLPPPPSFLYSDEIYPPNFFSSSETKDSLLWALEGTAFILLWLGPRTWDEEILASQSKLCFTCVSGTWEPQIHHPDGPGPAFTAYMGPWVHLPEGLHSHWLCAGGLVKGQLRMCGVMWMLGCPYTCHTVSLDVWWNRPRKEGGRLLARPAMMFPQNTQGRTSSCSSRALKSYLVLPRHYEDILFSQGRRIKPILWHSWSVYL